jgi:hypothetical protein
MFKKICLFSTSCIIVLKEKKQHARPRKKENKAMKMLFLCVLSKEKNAVK